MARSSQQRADSNKEDGNHREAKPAAPQAIEQQKRAPLAATELFASPFGLLSEFLGEMDRMMMRGAFPVFSMFGPGLRAALPHPAERRSSAGGGATWTPPLEVLTRDGHFLIRTEIPGIDKDHVNVEIDDGRAVISGEREEEHEANRHGAYRNERHYGRFSRVVTLPEGADAEQAQAMFADGILEIDIPVASPEHKAHRLEIHQGAATDRGRGDQMAEKQPLARRRQQRQGRKRGTTARASHGR